MIKSLNRSIAPPQQTISLPNFKVHPVIKTFGVDTLHVPLLDDVARFDIVFKTGVLEQPFIGALECIQALFLAGTENKKEEDILDELDMLGAYYGCDFNLNTTTFTLYSTPQLIYKAAPIFIDAILNATFPEEKLKLFKDRKKASLQSNLEKTTYLAKTKCNNLFYKTPILKEQLSSQNYDNISREALLNYHQNHLKQNVSIYYSGNYKGFPDDVIGELSKISCNTTNATLLPQIEKLRPNNHEHLNKADAIQTSIRAKSVGLGRKHIDYPKLQLSNAVFGGFFGSLLMKNIREDKGLTYGISSSLSAEELFGTINIQGDIKSNYIDIVFESISTELKALHNGTFEKGLFEKAKNYLLGNIAKSFDETFAILDKSKLVYLQNLSETYHHAYFEAIKACSLHEMIETAQAYLNFESFIFVTCGPET